MNHTWWLIPWLIAMGWVLFRMWQERSTSRPTASPAWEEDDTPYAMQPFVGWDVFDGRCSPSQVPPALHDLNDRLSKLEGKE